MVNRLTKRIFLIAAFVAVPVVAFVAWTVIRTLWDERIRAATWKLMFYTTIDGGLSHEINDHTFETLTACKAFAEAKSHGDVVVQCAEKDSGCVADSYLCGLGCSVDAFVGSVFIEEYRCKEQFKGSLR